MNHYIVISEPSSVCAAVLKRRQATLQRHFRQTLHYINTSNSVTIQFCYSPELVNIIIDKRKKIMQVRKHVKFSPPDDETLIVAEKMESLYDHKKKCEKARKRETSF